MTEKDLNRYENIREVLSKIFSGPDIDVETIKDEVWQDLANIYYKYDDEEQKRAFREVMKEIANDISDENWKRVYQKIYRKGV